MPHIGVNFYIYRDWSIIQSSKSILFGVADFGCVVLKAV